MPLAVSLTTDALLQPSERLARLSSLIRFYWRTNLDSILHYARELDSLGIAFGNLNAQADAADAISYALERRAEYDTALVLRKKALSLYLELSRLDRVAWSYHSLGNLYDYLGLPDAALSFHFKALRLRDSLGLTKDLLWSYNRIADIYLSQGKDDLARSYREKALELAKALNDPSALCATIGALAKHEVQTNPNQAEQYARQSLALADSLGDKFYAATAISVLGDVELFRNHPKSALSHYRKALMLFEEFGAKRLVSRTLIDIGNAYLRLGAYDSAAAVAAKALSTAMLSHSRNEEKAAWLLLTDIAVERQDYKQAVAFQMQYIALRDSILSEERERNIAFLQEEFETRRKEQLLQHLAREKELEQNRRNLLLAATGIITALGLGIFALLVALNRQKQIRLQETEARAKVLEKMNEIQASLRAEAEMAQLDLEKANRALSEALQKLAEKHAEAEQEREKAITASNKLAEALAAIERQRDELAEQRRIAEEASAFKSELLAIAAHDLKNPLQVILGFAQLLKGKLENPELAAQIESAARKMLALIKELLESTAVEAGQIQLDLQPTNIGALVKLSVSFNEPAAAQKNQTIHFEAAPNCFANVDARRFTEVIDNLISNAIKYSPSGANIYISVARLPLQHSHRRRKEDWPCALPENDVIEIAVRDEGQGLSEEDMRKIFRRFQRLSAQPTGGETSTGLGLSIAKRIVELHSGLIWAESAGLGKGATFYVALPAMMPIATDSPEQLQVQNDQTTSFDCG
ncbi:MAG: tetratricopeptide repeat protein [Chloroherpetonaceae bacterium]|nr:ATP-binding protein [Chloroherpetonaceae bacterium]MDW8020708.1 tetratricopeptide repeat protein [Chloroherpetonaceae bacterium]